jgi:membrane-bound lytic murein transglycosylase B
MARFGRAQKASALLPLAVLSAAWTASLATASSGSTAGTGTLPDGTEVPAQAVHAPASLTSPQGLTPGIHGNVDGVVATASASGIPAVALAAYQRAATVIDAADRSCHLPWQLVAAIGRVESDHGRTDGNVLTDQGIARPGIFGPVLDGTHGTALIRDTDAGQYDHDARYDRAVGPMQFIPSTWAIVGVDADNDGLRNPQDVYDASLGSAVYLCSGSDDLSTDAGQRSSVFRYNHSQRYVALVLAIMHAYQNGDFSTVPNGTTTTGFSFGTPPATTVATGRHARHHTRPHGSQHHGHHTPTASSTTPTSGPTAGPTAGSTGGVPVPQPTGNPTHLPLPSSLPTSLPTTLPTSLPTLLTHAQAVAQCLAQGLVDNPLDPNDAFDQCVYDLTH